MGIEIDNFSLWVDFVEREFVESDLKDLIDRGVVSGATSNPAIFKSAISTSSAYKRQLEELKGCSPKQKYEAVAIYDIQQAADALRSVYDKNRDDGFVSIEIDPLLCDDADLSIEEGRRLYAQIDRDNVMIKVPATKAGFEVMKRLASQGIPVNATLIFSLEQARGCVEAFKEAERVRSEAVCTVISVFVSRFDRKLDDQLERAGIDRSLTGIYNGSDIYEYVSGSGVARCRTLFASTGVKDDRLHPSYYVDALLATQSVNTAPLETIAACGKLDEVKLPIERDKIEKHFEEIATAGIDMDVVYQELIDDGLSAFKEAFRDILTRLE